MTEIRDLMHPMPVVVPSDTPLITCATHLLRHPDWRMLIAVDDGEVQGVIDDMAVFGNGVMLQDGLWFAFEPEGPDIAGTVAHEVPVVEASTDAGTALRRLHGETALIVVEGKEVVGLVTEHDVMALAPSMLTADRRVDETASRPVVHVGRNETAKAALQLMGDKRIRHLAVMDDGVLSGVVSLRDVVAAWVGPDTPMHKLRTADPFTVPLGTSLHTAATHMAERDVGCLPVVDGEGQVVAIMTRSDIVGAVAQASDNEDLFGG